jgi:EAL domain-containing protein (putative c-di-GMP-specific phosphodiesterase class I)
MRNVSVIQHGLSAGQFSVVYQPQVDATTTRVAAVEALVRWCHPEKGMIPPDVFIKQAERDGDIEVLGRWVLETACRDAAAWSGIRVAVNASPLQFQAPDFVAHVKDTLNVTGLSAGRLELEITEGIFFADAKAAEQQMDELRCHGIRLALDDFGTGFSSLSYLRQMPFDKVKIDKSFVQDIDRMESAAIIHAIVALARAIGLKVTAEGVETAEQHRFLKICGCHFLQGYLFSKPIPAEQITSLLMAEVAAVL